MRDAARFDRYQFDRKALPVDAHVTADGIESNALSFDDYDKAHCFTHKLFASRRNTPPSWAMNLGELGLLLARYFERRAGIICPRIDTPQRRVIHAQSKILAAIPAQVAVLDRLSREFVTAKNTGDTRAGVLEKQIRSLDGKLCIDKRGPALIVGIIHYFFRVGYDSVETAAALNHAVSPVGCRQIASRLTRLWEQMQDGTDRKPKPAEIRKAKSRAQWVKSGYNQKQLEREKAERAKETLEQRAARLKYANDYYHAHRDRISAQQRANWRKRDKAMERYRSLTPAQIEERRRKAREYAAKKRERLNAYARERHARKAAAMSPAEREIKRAQSRAYAAAHRGRIREVHRAHRVRRKARKVEQNRVMSIPFA